MDWTLNKIKQIIAYIIEILFPTYCLGCKSKNEILCPDCISNISRTEKEIGKDIFAIFNYHDPIIKKIIWNLKYYKYSYLGKKLGEILYDELLENISEIRSYSMGSPIIVIPVPISKHKRKIRGYNQAEKIARGFCNSNKDRVFDLKENIIFKKLKTIPQARITNRERRLKNIKGSFEIKNNNIIIGKTIILIDDVTTTGGTMNEIMKLLKKSGAKKVIGFAIAH